MKIGVAQIKPIIGNISQNIIIHKEMIQLAIAQQVDFIFFPELSLTGYEPKLADQLKLNIHDQRLKIFQSLSNKGEICIGLGAPTEFENKPQISMMIFRPEKEVLRYSKQYLHVDEQPYFQAGNNQLIIDIKNYKMAIAICFESLNPDHLKEAIRNGANIYIASVAKDQKSLDKANKYFNKAAQENSIDILMSNSIGYCDNFLSAGQSAIWNNKGERLYKLSNNKESLLIYDISNQKAFNL